MASIQIALKAIDQYSGVLTGLNQGFELIGKAIAGVQKVAEVAFAGVQKSVELAAQGGQYAEMRRQFNNVAESFGSDGQRILDSLDEITVATLSLEDAAMLAGKGITAGLSDNQLEQAFTFIKRRTELTGESFTALSEKVFTAISTGRTSTLAQLGLVVEAGASVEDVMQAITTATEQYGDAGFSAKDKIDALSNQQERLTRAIGVAINETPEFQRILTTVTDAVISFVQNFDPRPVSIFFGAALDGIKTFLTTAIDLIPGLSDLFDALWDQSADGAGDFAKNALDSVFSVVKAVGEGVNQVLDLLTASGIATAIQFLASAAIDTVQSVFTGIVDVVGLAGEFIIFNVESWVNGVRELVSSLPEAITKRLGVDAASIAETQAGLNAQRKAIEQTTNSINNSVRALGEGTQGVIADLGEGARNWRIDLGSIDEKHAELKGSLEAIDYSKTWGEDLGAATSKVDQAASQIAQSLDASSRLDIDVDDSRVDSAIDKLDRQKKIKLDLDDPQSKEKDIADRLAAVNWPQEFAALGEFLLNWVLEKAAGERVPLAIATS